MRSKMASSHERTAVLLTCLSLVLSHASPAHDKSCHAALSRVDSLALRKMLSLASFSS